jgi:hypothetical protein
MPEAIHPTELFSRASRSFEAAVQSGIRIQEESLKCVTEIINENCSPETWQKKTQTLITEMVSTSQKNVDDAVAVLNENTKTGLEFFQKAFEAAPADSSEAQAKTVNLWETALGALRRNTDVMLKANSRIVEAWTEMAKKINGDQFEKMAKMAQKASQEVSQRAQEFARDTMQQAKQTTQEAAAAS